MKIYNSLFVVAQVAAVLVGPVHAQAQQTAEMNASSPMWQRIKNSNVARFHGIWKRQIITTANPKFSAQTLADVGEAQLPAGTKVNEKVSAIVKQSQEQYAAALRSGTTFQDRLDVVRVGDAIRVGVTITDTTRCPAPFVDYFDGQNSVTLFSQMSNEGKVLSTFKGAVTRKPEERLGGSIPFNLPVLLAQAPIFSYFNPENSVLEQKDGQLLLTQKQLLPNGFDLQRLVLRADTLAPLSLQSISQKGRTRGHIMERFDVQKTTVISGVIVPTQVAYTTTVSDMPGGQRAEYDLQQPTLNAAVDSSLLRLPAQSRVTDYRFGDKNPVAYPVADGKLLPDAKVKVLLGEQKRMLQQTSPSSSPQDSKFAVPLAPISGLTLIALGGLLLVGRRKET